MAEAGIVGGGALGLFLYARLKEAGREPVLFVRREEQKKALAKGLQVTEGRKVKTYPVRACLSSERGEKKNYLFFCTKAYDLERALQEWLSQAQPGAFLLFLQNGWGFWKKVGAQAFRKGFFPYALSLTFGLTKRSDREVEVRGEGKAFLGALRHPAPQERELLKLLTQAKLHPCLELDIFSFLRKKMLVNSIINPLTMLAEVENGKLLHPVFKNFISQALEEVEKEKREELWRFVREVARKTARNRSSMLQDYLNGKKTEIDFLNGQFSAPTHRLLTLLVKAKTGGPLYH